MNTMKIFLILALFPTIVAGSLDAAQNDHESQHRELVRRRFFWWLFPNQNNPNPLRPSPFRPNRPGASSPPPPPPPPRECARTSDCEDEEYCSSGQCQSFGTCQNDVDCRNPQNTYPVIECTGPLLCFADNTCGRECGPNCPDGSQGVNCLVQPCSLADSSCEMSSFVSCVDDYCNGCSAVVFDEAGNHEVCPNIAPTGGNSGLACSRTSECGSDYYCSFGECREIGTCSGVADCRNPANAFDVIDCVGPIFCEDGVCSKECAATECPGGEEPVMCFVSPCEVLGQTCNETFATCDDDYCGGCNAFAFDEAGNRVCEDTTTQGGQEAPPISCVDTRDCPADDYCAGGVCLPAGSCAADLDCLNPNNVYPMAACVGLVQCYEDGTCGIDCELSECRGGGPPVDCNGRPPCDVISCEVEYEHCINDYCDGCDAIFLDFAGNRVCET